MQNQQQSLFLKFSDAYRIGSWIMEQVSLTLMVYLRRDVGYRLLGPGRLFAIFGLLALVTSLFTPGNEEARPWLLLIFCGIGFLNGLAQRIRRWREMNQGINRHSYYIGSSPFDYHWLPAFFRRNRRMGRYFDPLFCAAIGIALFPFSRALAAYLVFAAFCLKGYEFQTFQRKRNSVLDLFDAVAVGEVQAQELEQFKSESASSAPRTDTGIPTGMGSDIDENIRQNRKSRASRRG